jgi:hypothetical protein
MTVNYTASGMESLLDSYDSGTSSTSNFELDLNQGSNTKSLIMIQGSLKLTGASTANLGLYIRSNSNAQANWFNTVQSVGTTNSYYWSNAVPYQYTTYYRLSANNTYQVQMMLDCENNGTSSPYKRMNLHVDGFGYTQYGMRMNITDGSRAGIADPYKMYCFCTSGSMYVKINSYAITGR